MYAVLIFKIKLSYGREGGVGGHYTGEFRVLRCIWFSLLFQRCDILSDFLTYMTKL